MPLGVNYDKGAGSSDILLRISEATGLNNFTRSSITRVMAESMAHEIDKYHSLVGDLFDQTNVNTATGRFLDIIGQRFGLSRGVADSIKITEEDEAVSITTLDGQRTFKSILGRQSLVLTESDIIVDHSSGFQLILNKGKTIDGSLTSSYISVTLKSTRPVRDNINPQPETISFSTNDTLRIDASSILAIEEGAYNSINIRFNKPISLEIQSESDENFRRRILFQLTKSPYGTSDAIGEIIESIPGISGYTLFSNLRGPNSIDIGIITVSDITGDINNSVYLFNLVEDLVKEYAPMGTAFNIFKPKLLETHIEYSSLGNLSHEVVADNLKSIINSQIYNNSNIISIEDIELEMREIFPDEDSFTISKLYLVDPDTSGVMFSSSGLNLTLPIEFFLRLTDISTVTKV